MVRSPGLTARAAPSPRRRSRTLPPLLVPLPARAVVIEDVVCGVAAGRAGGFGPVIDVDCGAGSELLGEAGADVVVRGLAELVTA